MDQIFIHKGGIHVIVRTDSKDLKRIKVFFIGEWLVPSKDQVSFLLKRLEKSRGRAIL